VSTPVRDAETAPEKPRHILIARARLCSADSPYSWRARLVGHTLLQALGWDESLGASVAFHSEDKLAKLTRTSVSTVKRGLRELCDNDPSGRRYGPPMFMRTAPRKGEHLVTRGCDHRTLRFTLIHHRWHSPRNAPKNLGTRGIVM
jgi:hypothetical protein